MPQAKTKDFCPQCGCRRIAVKGLGGGCTRHIFDCQEEVIERTTDGTTVLTTSYTCRTVPAKMRELEETLRRAIVALFDTAPVAYTISEALVAAADTVDGFVTLPAGSYRRLESLGILDPDKARGGHTLTTLGRYYAQHLKEEEKKWTTLSSVTN